MAKQTAIKRSRSPSSRVLTVSRRLPSFRLLLLLLLHDPLLALDGRKLATALSATQRLVTRRKANVVFGSCVRFVRESFRKCKIGVVSGLQNKIHLFGFRTMCETQWHGEPVRVIDDESSDKPALHGGL